jgi:hypothetical protein
MNTKKILGIFICMLVMTMIPVAAGATTHQNPQPSKIGWTTFQGITLTQPKSVNGGALITFKCLFVHYVCQGLGQRTTGFRYGGQEMIIPGTFHGLMSNHVIAGWCPGALEF